MRVALIFGGRSCEHEVSLRSAEFVRSALRRSGHEVVDIQVSRAGRWQLDKGRTALGDGPQDGGSLQLVPGAESAPSLHGVDLVFPLVHGTNGEDGALQGLLEMAGVPYVGCGVLGSALAMDKEVAKRLLFAAGVPVVAWKGLTRWDCDQDEEGALHAASDAAGLPAFVKPANLGSSVGVSRVDSFADLKRAVHRALQFDDKILVEGAVPQARELEVSVLGWHTPEASVVGEVRPHAEFYDYDAKYHDDSTELIVPANLPAVLSDRVRALAAEAFRVLEGCGMARVDFLMNGDTEELFLNEINTIPGFTSASMYPKLWEASGLSGAALMQRLMDLALERHTVKSRLRVSLD